MPADLSSYLATHYLTADPKPTKKRKRKHGTDKTAAGLLITDDDDASWAEPTRRDGDGDGDADAPATVAGTSAEFRRAKKSGWKTVGDKAAAAATTRAQAKAADDADAADRILASAAAERRAGRGDEDDETPVVAGAGAGAGEGAIRMSDGTHAGLQSAASVAAQLTARRAQERAAFERAARSGDDDGAAPGETVYRDATGRRVDVTMRRAEARRAAAEAEGRERAAREALGGDVQAEAARRRRRELDDARLMAVARTADDEDMNREMREARRWNDPMTQFLSSGGGGGGGGGDGQQAGQGRGGSSAKKDKRRPLYKGHAPPNRYGILPGYRWDGVDRGNGFEAERFKAINRRERNKGLEYSWQMDE